LQPGDVVVEVNRKPVASAEQFASAVHATPAGKDILLLVWSKGNESYRVLHPDDNGRNGMYILDSLGRAGVRSI
jgi:serine protease Do